MSHNNELKQYRLKTSIYGLDIDGWYTKKQIADIAASMIPIQTIGDIEILGYAQTDETYVVANYNGEIFVVKREAVKGGYRFKLKGENVRLV